MHFDFLTTFAFWRAALEVLILAVANYYIYRMVYTTRTAQILAGAIVVFLVVTLSVFLLKLNVIGFILTRIIAPVIMLMLVIIFQPEIRNALARLGNSSWLRKLHILPFVANQQNDFISTFVAAVSQLSSKRFGALIAIMREENLDQVYSSGVVLDAQFSQELTTTIFHPKTALHDGGIIINRERIQAAACIFPVSNRELSDKSVGLRHRAAIGMSEQSDAIVVVVSEETGHISICCDGRMERNLSDEDFKAQLVELMNSNQPKAAVVKSSRNEHPVRPLFKRKVLVPALVSLALAIVNFLIIHYYFNNNPNSENSIFNGNNNWSERPLKGSPPRPTP